MAECNRDERLAELLVQLDEAKRRGVVPDIERMSREQPDLANELRELWTAAGVADALASPDMHSSTTLRNANGAGDSETLPRELGDYELIEELGRGGMGVVFKARQRSLDRIVALKMILQGGLASGVDLARFRAEAGAAARLRHPHIVPVYEANAVDGLAFFTMQYVEGTTLSRVAAGGPLPARMAATHMVKIARAIQHAHENGILHRDLKPANVLLDRSGEPFVTDFGLAKRVAAASLTHTGAILGTPGYMAPEQAAASRGMLGPATDVYGLGAILYELLTGRAPFQGVSPVDTLLLVLEQEPMPPRLLNHAVDRDLEMICLKCLRKSPELRYASPGELADDLDAYLAGERLGVRSGGLTYQIMRLLSETHHAVILRNWGLLWMWHSLVLFVLCALTNVLQWEGVTQITPYLALWVVGLGTWSLIFLALRRRGGPVSFVERQIMHVWAGSTLGCMSLFLIERLLGLPVLTLSPVLAIFGAMVFLIKAGVLSGWFYLPAGACLASSLFMALVPDYGLVVYGAVAALSFFIPGLKYYRQQARQPRPEH